MKRTLAIETSKAIGQEVLVKGWVHARRDHGKLIFIDLRDRSGILQIIFNPAVSEEAHQIANTFRPEFAIVIKGKINKRPEKLVNPKIVSGTVELEATHAQILSEAESLPFDMGGETLNVELPTLLDHRSLTLRHPMQQAIFKVQEVVIDSFRNAMKEKEFVEFQAPSIIPTIPEGGAEVFEVQYFDHKAYLAQSPQLYKQIMVGVYERVFSVNKTFRAEPSVTTRHLAEVVSLDAEFGFIDSWLDVVDMAEYTITYILKSVQEKCSKELTMFGVATPQIKNKIPIVKLKEAQELVYKRTGLDERREKDLSPEGEREICKWAFEEKESELVFVSHYPTRTKPFYTYPDPENPEFNQGFDLLGRGFEWMTGGRRIEDYALLVEHAKKWGVDVQKIELYLQAFRYGIPPEGGFAFGAERITQAILRLPNIREASLFPRDMERVDERFSEYKESPV